MPSTTRGSILISTANDIGTTLVDKLGGTGYTPDEWDSAANLCGIASADIEAALENITESTPQGADRGSMSIAKANSIGSVLNKKFNTSRGFKPSEWASAISKLSPLPERTASGAIAHITDGADTVPIKSWQVTLPASLSGYSAIVCTKSGKNLVNGYTDYNATNKIVEPVFLKAGNYTISFQREAAVSAIYVRKGDTVSLVGDAYLYKYNTTFFAFNADVDGYYYFQLYRSGSSTTWEDAPITNVQLEVGSTATTYEPYTAPTTATASLGRTIYGGTADIVNGTGTDDTIHYELGKNDSWSAYSGANHSFWHNVGTGEDRPIDQTKLSECICNHLTYSTASPSSAPDFTFLVQGGQRIVVTADSTIDTVDKFKTWLETNPLVFTCPASSSTDFTFTPLSPTPETPLGVSNWWADNGDSQVTYRADIDLAQ